MQRLSLNALAISTTVTYGSKLGAALSSAAEIKNGVLSNDCVDDGVMWTNLDTGLKYYDEDDCLDDSDGTNAVDSPTGRTYED